MCQQYDGERKFLEAMERHPRPVDDVEQVSAGHRAVLARTQSTLCDVAQLIDGAIKDDSWSEWDQSVRDAVTARMIEIERLIK